MVLSRIAVPVVAEKRLHFSIEEMAHRHEEIFARLGLWNEAHGLQVRICDEDFPRAPDIVARRRRIDFVFIGRHGPCECDEAVLAVEDKRRPLQFGDADWTESSLGIFRYVDRKSTRLNSST